MKKLYCIYDTVAEETVSTFFSNNDDMADIQVKKSIEKQPLFGKVELYYLCDFDVNSINMTNIKPRRVSWYGQNKKNK